MEGHEAIANSKIVLVRFRSRYREVKDILVIMVQPSGGSPKSPCSLPWCVSNQSYWSKKWSVFSISGKRDKERQELFIVKVLIFSSNMNLFSLDIYRTHWDIWEYQHVFCFLSLIVYSLLFLVFNLNCNSKRCWCKGANSDEQLRVINMEWLCLCDTSCIFTYCWSSGNTCFPSWFSGSWQADWFPWEFNSENGLGQGRENSGRTRSASGYLLCSWNKKEGLRKTVKMLKEIMGKWDPWKHQHIRCRREVTAHSLFCALPCKCSSSGTNLGNAF